MWIIKKSVARRVLSAALVVTLAAIIVVGVTLAATPGVTISTTPMYTVPIYVDRNSDGLNTADESLGTMPVYDGNQPLVFTWQAYPFASGVNGSYLVSLWQNTTPFAAPTWVQLKVAHHWASSADGTKFTMGAFGFGEDVCTTCPSMIVVLAETYTLVFNQATQSYEYVYQLVTPSQAAPPAGSSPEAQTSGSIMISIFRVEPEKLEPCRLGVEDGGYTIDEDDLCSCRGEVAARCPAGEIFHCEGGSCSVGDACWCDVP